MNKHRGEQPLRPHQPAGARSLAGLLGVLALVALLVGGAWRYARQDIADNADRQALAELSAVLPASLYDNEPHRDVVQLDTGGGQPLPVYRARRNGIPAGAVLTVIAPDGYVGPVRLLVGISADGRVLGVRVSAHTETPGIGAAIAATSPDWLGTFAGRSLADPPASRWTVRSDGGDFDAIAGATVSSRAVVGGVRRAMQYFATHQDEIFARQDGTRGTE
ncbi:MAG: RnfABCDGE type electron transport complex subunit G [Chromatiales bacterium]|nr:RnfABCDGE type electron transport complex subunit G [Chromatiales bacterium]